MTPATIRLRKQEIEFERGNLTAAEQWARAHDNTDQRRETFRYINWRRARLKDEEQLLDSVLTNRAESLSSHS